MEMETGHEYESQVNCSNEKDIKGQINKNADLVRGKRLCLAKDFISR